VIFRDGNPSTLGMSCSIKSDWFSAWDHYRPAKRAWTALIQRGATWSIETVEGMIMSQFLASLIVKPSGTAW
jgi:hypothetical protein